MRRLLLPVLALTLCGNGCAAFSDDSGSGGDPGSRASGDPIQVAAAFYPLAFLAERVGGDHVEVTNLTSPGAEPHDLELTWPGCRS